MLVVWVARRRDCANERRETATYVGVFAPYKSIIVNIAGWLYFVSIMGAVHKQFLSKSTNVAGTTADARRVAQIGNLPLRT